MSKELIFTIDEKGGLIKKVEIREIRPCVVAENMVRVLLQADAELNDIIPYLVSKYPPGKVNYIERKKVLTLSLFNRLITLYPSGKISMNKTVDQEDAIKVIREIVKDINQTYDELQKGGIEDYSEMKEKLSSIGPLDIYNCLPQTSCGKCGESTCMAFAVKLLAGEKTLNQCTPLLESDKWINRDCLNDILGSQLLETLGGFPKK